MTNIRTYERIIKVRNNIVDRKTMTAQEMLNNICLIMSETKGAEIVETSYTINDIKHIVIKDNNNTITFKYKGDTWQWKKDT